MIIKLALALAAVALAYVLVGPVAAGLAALPIIGFMLRRVVLGRRTLT